jgi:hypothetical protein
MEREGGRREGGERGSVCEGLTMELLLPLLRKVQSLHQKLSLLELIDC